MVYNIQESEKIRHTCFQTSQMPEGKITMKISPATHTLTMSFEVFPPKTDTAFAPVRQAALEIAGLSPRFVSVTYGAGGNGSRYTFALCREIEEGAGVPTLAHLTCVGQTKQSISASLTSLKEAGIDSIMALRGDLPEGMTGPQGDFPHAVDLIRFIRETNPEFTIGGACYPEIHPESPDRRGDLKYLKEKVDAGCDFLTTQMFFDNALYFHFLYRIREIGIHVPVFPGIMPITSVRQIERAVTLSHSFMPTRFKRLVDHFGSNGEAMKQAGIAYAVDQIIDLYASGIEHVHVYTMNKPDVAAEICRRLSGILGSMA